MPQGYSHRFRASRLKWQDGYDAVPAPDVEDPLVKRHEECSRHLRNSVLAFAAFAVICWTALSRPDVELVAAQATVKMAALGVEVSLDNFLAIAPIVAFLLLVHSAVFRLRLSELDSRVGQDEKFSVLFNLPGGVAQFATLFLHVLIPLLLLVLLLAKTCHRPGFSGSLIFFSFASLALLEVHALQTRPDNPFLSGRPLPVIIVGWLSRGVVVGIFLGAIILPLGEWYKDRCTQLTPLNFRGIDFVSENRSESVKATLNVVQSTRSFAYADFSSTRLNGARLQGAELANANISFAEARGTNFDNSNLQGADLSYGQFQQAGFSAANLKNALMQVSNFDDTIFDSADLTGADVSESSFNRASFAFVKMDNTRFDGCSFKGTTFIGYHGPVEKFRDCKIDGASFPNLAIPFMYLGLHTTNYQAGVEELKNPKQWLKPDLCSTCDEQERMPSFSPRFLYDTAKYDVLRLDDSDIAEMCVDGEVDTSDLFIGDNIYLYLVRNSHFQVEPDDPPIKIEFEEHKGTKYPVGFRERACR